MILAKKDRERLLDFFFPDLEFVIECRYIFISHDLDKFQCFSKALNVLFPHVVHYGRYLCLVHLALGIFVSITRLLLPVVNWPNKPKIYPFSYASIFTPKEHMAEQH